MFFDDPVEAFFVVVNVCYDKVDYFDVDVHFFGFVCVSPDFFYVCSVAVFFVGFFVAFYVDF